jgi:hypothetical protein
MMVASSCLHLVFGFDAIRQRFFYSTMVEQILTFGCSVWASFLRTKAGVKKVLPFQCSICRMITSSFKTATKESLIQVKSNLLPIYLKILEMCTLRYLPLLRMSVSATPRENTFSIVFLLIEFPTLG